MGVVPGLGIVSQVLRSKHKNEIIASHLVLVMLIINTIFSEIKL